MKTIHLVLQGKGGVGKSVVASMLCQYILAKGMTLTAFDTDPVNQSLVAMESLKAIRLNIRTKDDDINRRIFDQLMDAIINEPDGDRQFVIDNGSGSFLPLCAWMRENQTIDMWQEMGVRVLLHSVVTGGQGQDDTLDGLEVLMTYFKAPIVAWLNSFLGEIEYTSATTGKTLGFEDFDLYKKNSGRFMALIRIPLKSPQTFGKDLEELFKRHQTFDEAQTDDALPIMVKQRLKLFWKEMCQEIDNAGVIETA